MKDALVVGDRFIWINSKSAYDVLKEGWSTGGRHCHPKEARHYTRKLERSGLDVQVVKNRDLPLEGTLVLELCVSGPRKNKWRVVHHLASLDSHPDDTANIYLAMSRDSVPLICRRCLKNWTGTKDVCDECHDKEEPSLVVIPDDKTAADKLLSIGARPDQVADITGIPRSRMRTPEEYVPGGISNLEVEVVYRYLKGSTLSEVADRLEISQGRAYYIVRKYGVNRSIREAHRVKRPIEDHPRSKENLKIRVSWYEGEIIDDDVVSGEGEFQSFCKPKVRMDLEITKRSTYRRACVLVLHGKGDDVQTIARILSVSRQRVYDIIHESRNWTCYTTREMRNWCATCGVPIRRRYKFCSKVCSSKIKTICMCGRLKCRYSKMCKECRTKMIESRREVVHDRIIRLRREGRTYNQIAEETGYSIPNVYRILRLEGLTNA